MTAGTAQIAKFLGAWQAVATRPNVISEFKQTASHSVSRPQCQWTWLRRRSPNATGQPANVGANSFE
jgi:hypothetical protein